MKQFVALLSVLLLSGVAYGQPSPQDYPSRPIKLVVPYAPGGGLDVFNRPLSIKLAELMGQWVVIENRAGASGVIGADVVAKSAPDGHTWFLGNNGILATNQALYQKMPFDSVRDFATVVLIATQPSVLVTHPSLPVKNVKELVALAKARPGQLNYASSGTGTAGHLAGELFKGLAGVNYQHIPYKGGGPAVIDLVSGHVHFMFATAASVIPHARSGRLRALAIVVFMMAPLTPWSVYLFSSFMGLLWLSTVPPTNAIVAQVFGVQYMSMLGGIVFFSHQIGSFLGVWLGGKLYDLTGSYQTIFTLFVGLYGLSAVCMLLARRPAGVIVGDPDLRAVFAAALDEAVAVAQARGAGLAVSRAAHRTERKDRGSGTL